MESERNYGQNQIVTRNSCHFDSIIGPFRFIVAAIFESLGDFLKDKIFSLLRYTISFKYSYMFSYRESFFRWRKFKLRFKTLKRVYSKWTNCHSFQCQSPLEERVRYSYQKFYVLCLKIDSLWSIKQLQTYILYLCYVIIATWPDRCHHTSINVLHQVFCGFEFNSRLHF